MYFVFASSHFFHIIMTYFFKEIKVGFFFCFLFFRQSSYTTRVKKMWCQLRRQHISCVQDVRSNHWLDHCCHGNLRLRRWLTTDTIGGLTHFKNRAPYMLCLYPPLNTENNAWHVTERLLTLNNTVFNSWMINCLSLRDLHCSPSLTFKTFQSFFWTFDPNYDGIIVELCHF